MSYGVSIGLVHVLQLMSHTVLMGLVGTLAVTRTTWCTYRVGMRTRAVAHATYCTYRVGSYTLLMSRTRIVLLVLVNLARVTYCSSKVGTLSSCHVMYL